MTVLAAENTAAAGREALTASAIAIAIGAGFGQGGGRAHGLGSD